MDFAAGWSASSPYQSFCGSWASILSIESRRELNQERAVYLGGFEQIAPSVDCVPGREELGCGQTKQPGTAPDDAR